MNTRHQRISTLISRATVAALVSGLIGLAPVPALAQTATLEIPPGDPPHAATELETLVGPIALYPDDLIGIVLPASTYPLQIVQAKRFLEQQASDASLQPDDEWDNAVVALLNYPEVLELMDANIDWTWALGEAVLAQQSDVIDAIQSFRTRAYTAGNLRSDERQVITQNEGVIEIAPADPEVIYIPYYEPERVVIVQPRPAYYYYTRPYPVYYYPYPVGYSFGYRFGHGFFWGVTSIFDIGWHNHYVHVYHHRHNLHPYYGYTYYAPYYARRGVNININLNHVSHVWQPRERRAARPLVGRGRVVTNREGYSDERTRRTTAGRSVTSTNQPRIGREVATGDARQRASQTPQRSSSSPAQTRRATPGERGASRSSESSISTRLSNRTVRNGTSTSLSSPGTPQRAIGSDAARKPAVAPSTRTRILSPKSDVGSQVPAQSDIVSRTRVTPQGSAARPIAPQSQIRMADPGARAPASQGVTRSSRAMAPPTAQARAPAPPRQVQPQGQTQSRAPTFAAPRAQSAPRSAPQSSRSEAARTRSQGASRRQR